MELDRWTPRRWVPRMQLVAKLRPEDFVVEEVPLYAPTGEGTHLFVTVEKRGLTTAELVREAARRLGKRPGEIGCAGRKDARAVTRQTISVEHVAEADLAKLEEPGRIRVLSVARNARKLKMGHLLGNRFTIVLRRFVDENVAGHVDLQMLVPMLHPLTEEDCERARVTLTRFQREGVPNAFGEQRFGGLSRTHLLGRALLRREPEALLALLLGGPEPEREGERQSEARRRYEAGDLAGARDLWPRSYVAERAALEALTKGQAAAQAVSAIPRPERFLYVSAAQAHVWNALLEERRAKGELSRLGEGAVAWIHAKGACFLVEDEAREAPRAQAFEISPAGPLFGERCLEARGAERERELGALRAFDMEERHFQDAGRDTPPGARRPYRIPLSEPHVEAAEHGGMRLRFFLPAGAYATTVLGELGARTADADLVRRFARGEGAPLEGDAGEDEGDVGAEEGDGLEA